jgi:aryl-alcohol dehydrogenase-like predicted oxidoreductase
MHARLGLGLAALGRPGYVTLNHAADLGGRYDPASMELNAHEVLEAAFAAGIRYIDAARSYGRAEDFVASSKTLEDDALIDAIARLRERGIRAGLSVSGAGQDVAIRRSLEVRRDGQRVFDSVQATWNLLERGAKSALQDAHDAGMRVVVKEALANGRLTHGDRDEDGVFAPLVARIRELAESRGTNIETLALGAALARPWADVVLTGAATVGQIRSNVAALQLAYDAELEEQLRSVSIAPEEYWRARSSFKWN